MTENEGRGIESVKGTMPRNVNDRLATSYVNFYIANGVVIVLVFNDSQDENVLKTLGELFPERKVIGTYSREILLGGGNIHCITQQVPSRN